MMETFRSGTRAGSGDLRPTNEALGRGLETCAQRVRGSRSSVASPLCERRWQNTVYSPLLSRSTAPASAASSAALQGDSALGPDRTFVFNRYVTRKERVLEFLNRRCVEL